MLVCFGAAWPFSIYRSYISRSNAGKSVAFLFVVLIGYIAGIFHKIFNNFDAVVYLYGFNGILVIADILLYYRNTRAGGSSNKGILV